jgi:hypothetical protein
MASVKLPWEVCGRALWGAIPSPLVARAAGAGARRFDQSEDEEEDLRLPANVRSCGQEEPGALAVGADDRRSGDAEDPALRVRVVWIYRKTQ